MSVHGVPLLGGLLETMIINSYESVISKVCLYVYGLAVKLGSEYFSCNWKCCVT